MADSAPEIAGLFPEHQPEHPAGERFHWKDAKRHLQGCIFQAKYVNANIQPVPDFDRWMRNMFASTGGGIAALKYIREFTSEDFVEAWKAFMKSKTGHTWSGTWVANARTNRWRDLQRGQESEAQTKQATERADTAAMDQGRNDLVKPIGKPLEDEARDKAWDALDKKERDRLIEEARTVTADGSKSKFSLPWRVGNMIARARWWEAQK